MRGCLLPFLALSLLGFSGAPSQSQEFDLAQTVEFCAGCHGDNGVPVGEEIPIIWGQEFYYIYVQLRDYQAGRRANEIMRPIASEFDKAQMKEIAQYFSDKEWPRLVAGKSADRAAAGRSQAAAGQCAQCHSKYDGDSRVPRLAGQGEAYLERTMLEFKQKVRLNSPAKSSLMKSFEDDALRDIAHFLATL